MHIDTENNSRTGTYSCRLNWERDSFTLVLKNNQKQTTIYYMVSHESNINFPLKHFICTYAYFQVVGRWTWHSLHSVNMGT